MCHGTMMRNGKTDSAHGELAQLGLGRMVLVNSRSAGRCSRNTFAGRPEEEHLPVRSTVRPRRDWTQMCIWRQTVRPWSWKRRSCFTISRESPLSRMRSTTRRGTPHNQFRTGRSIFLRCY